MAGVLAVAVFVGTQLTSQASGSPEVPPPPSTHPNLPPGHPGDLPPGHPPTGDLPPGHPPMTGMPPSHPPIDTNAPTMAGAAAMEDGPALKWTLPKGWREVPNPSKMRLATYRIELAGAPEPAEMAVSVAGGSTEANMSRWIAQFDPQGQGTAKHQRRTIEGLNATVIEVEGSYAGGMGMDNAGPKSGWALLGAIVETGSGSSYFFKLTGPKAVVASARTSFDALLQSLRKEKK